METAGWIVIGVIGVAFAAVGAWLGMLWLCARASRSMTEVLRLGPSREELEELKRELQEIRRILEKRKRKNK